MQGVSPHSYTYDHAVADDGTVTFQCSTDIQKWPWLELHPFDPIVVQSINFWASVETATARGTWDPEKWSALTHITWQCGRQGVGHAVRGEATKTGGEETPGYRLRFYDVQDALVYEMDGAGVIFQTRDFETWRAKAKAKTEPPVDPAEFAFASAKAVGAERQEHCFVSPLIGRRPPSAQALVPKARSFMPAHPYHSGSGDHVNSNQLADVVRQFVNLLRGQETFLLSGEIAFNRYVELDRPFNIVATEDDGSDWQLSIGVTQADRPCAQFDMNIESAL